MRRYYKMDEIKYKIEEKIIEDDNEEKAFININVEYTYKSWKEIFKKFLERYDRELKKNKGDKKW